MSFEVFPEYTPTQAVFPLWDVAQLSDEKITQEMAKLGLDRFETVEDCCKRQIRDNALLEAAGTVPQRVLRALRREESLLFNDIPYNSGASHRAKRLCRAEVVLSASPFFGNDEESYFLTVVDSNFRCQKGDLHGVDPLSVLNSVVNRLRRVRGHNFRAVCGVEVSFIEDFGEGYWAPHVHAVFAGADPLTVRDGMRRIMRHSEAHRPVMVKPIARGEVPNTIAYSLKRWSDKKVRYEGGNGRRQSRRLPLPAALETEHIEWVLGSEPRDFMAFVGFKRNGRYLVTT